MKPRFLLVATLLAMSLVAERADADVVVAAHLDIVPYGYTRSRINSEPTRSEHVDTATGLGLEATVDLTPYLAIGVAPRFVAGVSSEALSDSGTQSDLVSLVVLQGEMAPNTRLRVFAGPGYSWLSFSRGGDNVFPHDVKGPVFAFGTSVTYAFSGATFITVELGGHIGTQEGHYSHHASGVSIERNEEVHTQLVSVGVGVGRRF